MRLLLNVIWLVFGGLVMAFGYAVVALVMFVLIITIPFGDRVRPDRAVLPLAVRAHDRAPARRRAPARPIGNIIWFVLAGWWLAIGHVITGVLMCITIIGIPLGLANFKLIPVSLTPFGREIVDLDQAQRLGIQPAVVDAGRPRPRSGAWMIISAFPSGSRR